MEQLGPEPALAVLRQMLWAEVSNLGIPIMDTYIPSAVYDADGGVDAVITATPKTGGNGLIFAPRTSYQVKAGDFSLSPTSLAQIEKLLITPAAIAARKRNGDDPSGVSHSPENISSRIRDCLDNGGTFVTMLFGNDSVDIEENAYRKSDPNVPHRG